MATNFLSIHGVKGIEIKGLTRLMGGGICRDIIVHTSEHDCDDFEITLFAAANKEINLAVRNVDEESIPKGGEVKAVEGLEVKIK